MYTDNLLGYHLYRQKKSDFLTPFFNKIEKILYSGVIDAKRELIWGFYLMKISASLILKAAANSRSMGRVMVCSLLCEMERT